MRRVKPVLIAFGGCLLVGTLVGANRLANNSGASPGGGGNPAPATPAKADGLVAKGRVVTEFEVAPIHLPAHLSSGTVQKVFVKEGQAVKEGAELVQFDDVLLQKDLKAAESELQYALYKLEEANKGVALYKVQVEEADLAVRTAERSLNRAKEVRESIRKTLEIQFRSLADASKTLAQWVQENVDYVKAEGMVEAAEAQVEQAKLKKKELEQASTAAAVVASTTEKARSAQSVVEKAREAVARCKLKTEIAGVVERIAAMPGQVVYPQSQPLFYLIPDGTRFVKAEIAPDFAHKIRDKDSGKVIISDDSNPGLTYEGTVEQVGSAFLPKAGGIDLLNGKSTYVLEVRVRVTDPAPAGKPPLRVNQPVRVTFP